MGQEKIATQTMSNQTAFIPIKPQPSDLPFIVDLGPREIHDTELAALLSQKGVSTPSIALAIYSKPPVSGTTLRVRLPTLPPNSLRGDEYTTTNIHILYFGYTYSHKAEVKRLGEAVSFTKDDPPFTRRLMAIPGYCIVTIEWVTQIEIYNQASPDVRALFIPANQTPTMRVEPVVTVHLIPPVNSVYRETEAPTTIKTNSQQQSRVYGHFERLVEGIVGRVM